MRRSSPRSALLLVLCAALAACGGDDDDGDDDDIDGGGNAIDSGPPADAFVADCEPQTGTNIALVEVESGFDSPVFVTSPPGDARLFVIEQTGKIKIIEDGQTLAEPFLDLGSIIVVDGGEQGLLGLAFHPDYATNRRFYVYYTADGPGGNGDDDDYIDVVAEYVASAVDPNVADSSSGTLILEIDDFARNHNGGMMAFDSVGYLHIGTGDGGGANDTRENGQDVTSLLGKMLRIDVDDSDGDLDYAIPSDNPLVDSETANVKREIWHVGVRNPWRWSFDRETGDQWIGDVGQDSLEEVDHIAAGEGGHNLGWDDKEGTACFEEDPCDAPLSDEPAAEFTDPIAEYVNPPEFGVDRAVVGGYVYRGTCFPDIVGWYFFADTYTGELWRIDADESPLPDKTAIEYEPAVDFISSFGEDSTGEIYVVLLDGTIYRLTAS